jgi:hypothetical protein
MLACQLKKLWNDTDVVGLYTNPNDSHEQHQQRIKDTSIGLVKSRVHGSLQSNEHQAYVLSI